MLTAPARTLVTDFESALGLQVFSNDGFDIRLEYGLSAGNGYVAQVPSARFIYRF